MRRRGEDERGRRQGGGFCICARQSLQRASNCKREKEGGSAKDGVVLTLRGEAKRTERSRILPNRQRLQYPPGSSRRVVSLTSAVATIEYELLMIAAKSAGNSSMLVTVNTLRNT
jgi:hypothetical protein